MECDETNRVLLITGASGFVGQALCTRLKSDGWKVRGTVRSAKKTGILPVGIDSVNVGSISHDTDWSKALIGVDTVVHLAARAHIVKETAVAPQVEFLRINTAGTELLAQKAAAAGVRRFVFLSSIGVNGTVTYAQAFSEKDDPHPDTPYAVSKLEAEQILGNIASKSRMEVVIIRSPLVYGPGNPGNFLRLLKVVGKGWPLPFAAVYNRRSLIYLGNLIDVIIKCIIHPRAAGQIYLVSDGEDVSSPELIRRIATALGRSARLAPFPLFLMRFAGKLIGKSSSLDRLLGSLSVDSSKIRRELGWTPPYTMAQGLQETADWYKTYLKTKNIES
jgi:nucleoside-diphosphate-sugar epimerase